MIIERTKSNKFGWRMKFKYRENLDLSISHEFNHNGYWKQSKYNGHKTHINFEDLKQLRDFLNKILDTKTNK